MATWSPVDLHLHTSASDGSLTPAELVALALERGLRVIAITDHDSTEGVDAALAAARGSGLEVIPGVEINTDVPTGEVHVLGYFLDHHDPVLRDRLACQRLGRLDRGLAMVQRLRELGLDVSWQRVQEIAGAAGGGAVGRPHVAQALVERGHVATVKEAFDRYIGNQGPAYVPRAKLTPEHAVRMICDAGGLAVLAHPAERPSWPAATPYIPSLVEAGLVGLECYYAGYTPPEVASLLSLARSYNLVPTGGSDFHGPLVTPDAPLGGTPVPLSVVDELRARKDRLAPRPAE